MDPSDELKELIKSRQLELEKTRQEEKRKQQEEKTPDEKVLGKRSNLFNKYDQLNQK